MKKKATIKLKKLVLLSWRKNKIINKILLEQNQITKKDIDDSISINIEDNDIKTLNINIIKDTDLFINQKTDKKEKLDININIDKNVKCNLIEYKKQGKYKLRYKYNLEENSYINVIKINDVKKIKEFIIINLNGKNAKINHLLKTIAKDEEKYDLMIYHHHKKTESNIINHGVNIKDGEIKFDVSGFVPKGIKECILDQKNRIINLTNNKCEIKPNLFIDEYDVIANHSAHIGKCKDEEMFYLQSRGIDKKEAESLLIKGFLKQKLENEKELMEKIIDKYWR